MSKDSKPVKTGLVLSNLHLAMIVAIIFFVIIDAYLYGQNQETQRKEVKQNPPSTLQPTPTAKPTPVPTINANTKQIISSPPSNPLSPTLPPSTPLPSIPTERKKVPVKLSAPTLSGTFYCYEDATNLIMSIQNNLNLALGAYEACVSTRVAEGEVCIQDCTRSHHTCLDDCEASNFVCFDNCRFSADYDACRKNCVPPGLACGDDCFSQNDACLDNCQKMVEACNEYKREIDEAGNRLEQTVRQYCP